MDTMSLLQWCSIYSGMLQSDLPLNGNDMMQLVMNALQPPLIGSQSERLEVLRVKAAEEQLTKHLVLVRAF